MDIQNRTLQDVVNSQSGQRNPQQQQDSQAPSFSTFLTVYSINLSHHFPDVTDLSSIDYDKVKRIAEFSAACSGIAVDTWQELSQSNQRRNVGARTRAA